MGTLTQQSTVLYICTSTLYCTVFTHGIMYCMILVIFMLDDFSYAGLRSLFAAKLLKLLFLFHIPCIQHVVNLNSTEQNQNREWCGERYK